MQKPVFFDGEHGKFLAKKGGNIPTRDITELNIRLVEDAVVKRLPDSYLEKFQFRFISGRYNDGAVYTHTDGGIVTELTCTPKDHPRLGKRDNNVIMFSARMRRPANEENTDLIPSFDIYTEGHSLTKFYNQVLGELIGLDYVDVVHKSRMMNPIEVKGHTSYIEVEIVHPTYRRRMEAYPLMEEFFTAVEKPEAIDHIHHAAVLYRSAAQFEEESRHRAEQRGGARYDPLLQDANELRQKAKEHLEAVGVPESVKDLGTFMFYEPMRMARKLKRAS